MPSSPEADANGDPRGAEAAAPAERDEPPVEAGQTRDSEADDRQGVALAESDERYKRALADLDNYRKRSAREVERRIAEAREAVLRDWLDVVDSVESALRMEPDGPCHEGMNAVLQQVDNVLRREGARRIGQPGDPFDPERHEAVAVRSPEDAADRTVLEVRRSGFELDDHVIRPAQVVVARAPERER
ncbi:MAG TPA: nucleotide exchange factor GrpE [Solirubrobacteraceae bacterium]|nr:nucleotide exchange factor GrpE [Solirubrobacteraceae bacterium]